MRIPMCSHCGAPCTPTQADESASALSVVEAARECFVSENEYAQNCSCPLPTKLHEALCALEALDREPVTKP